MAPRKNIPITTFSWTGATNDMLGLNMYIRPKQRKNKHPSRCVQMFPVSVWILKMLLKQARNEGMGGLWP